MFKGQGESIEFIGVLGWRCRIYTLFTPLEDRIGIVKNGEGGRLPALFWGTVSILDIDIDGTIWNNVI